MVSLATGTRRHRSEQLRKSCGYDGIEPELPSDVLPCSSAGHQQRASSVPAVTRMELPTPTHCCSLPMPLPRAMPPLPLELPSSVTAALKLELLTETSKPSQQAGAKLGCSACPPQHNASGVQQSLTQIEVSQAWEAPPNDAMQQMLSEMSSFGAVQNELRADVSNLVKSVGSVRELLTDIIEDLQTDLESLSSHFHLQGPECAMNGAAPKLNFHTNNVNTNPKARHSLSKKQQRSRSQRRVRRVSAHGGKMGGTSAEKAVPPNGSQAEADCKLVNCEDLIAPLSSQDAMHGDRSQPLVEGSPRESEHSQGFEGPSLLSTEPTKGWPLNLLPCEPLRLHKAVDLSELGHAIEHHTTKVLDGRQSVLHASIHAAANTNMDEAAAILHRSIILNPSRGLRMSLDILSLLVLLHDLTLIPFVLAWDIELVGFLGVTAMTTLIFWTIDIPISFLTGYYDQGELVMEPKKIAAQYLRTWFTIDFFVVTVDWVSTILSRLGGNSEEAESLNIIKMSKMGRLLRLFSVLRLIRGNKIFERLMDNSLSDYLHIGIQVIKILVAIIAIAHWMCCAWYAVGRLGPSPNWLDYETVTEDLVTYEKLEIRPIIWQYSSSFHWSVSQMASGSMDIPPQNSLERSFNIVCLLFGLLFGSSLVSLLSAFVIQLQDLRAEETKTMASLRKFLRQNSFSRVTASTVMKQVKERMGRQKRLNDDEVRGLDLIANSLRQRLKFESFSPFVYRHPLIRLWSEVEIAATEFLCSNAVNFLFLEVNDDLLEAGAEATHAYLHISGKLKYLSYGHPEIVMKHTMQTVEVSVEEGNWICEVALWAEWRHVGVFEAMSPCQLMSLCARTFWEAMAKFPHAAMITKEYGRLFHQRLITSYPPTAHYPNDVNVPFTDFEEIVTAMQEDMRRIVGNISLQRLHQSLGKKAKMYRQEMQNLTDEITSGKCTLIVNKNGTVHRVVAVVAINLTQADGLLLAQIGEIADDGSCEAGLNLPGSKMERGETPGRAVQRLLYSELLPFIGASELSYTESSQLVKESPHYGVLSKYHRTVFHARLASWFDCHQKLCQITADLSKDRASSDSTGWTPSTSLVHSRSHSQASTSWVYFNEHQLHSRSVYIITSSKKKAQAFAWLSNEEFKHLKSPEGQSDLEFWCGSLHMEKKMLPPPCQKFPI